MRAAHDTQLVGESKVLRDVVTNEPDSDLQVSHREVWERGSNIGIVVWRIGT